MRGHQPQPGECAHCMFETAKLTEVKAYSRSLSQSPTTPEDEMTWAWLCDVCLSNVGGKTYLHPSGYGSDANVITSVINWGINRILQEMKEPRDG